MINRARRILSLRGREPEREAVAALLAGAATGRGGALLFHGDLGIGKTALLRSAIAQAGGFTVVALAAYESESAWPFAALHRLLHLIADQVPGPAADQSLALLRTTEGDPSDNDQSKANGPQVDNYQAELNNTNNGQADNDRNKSTQSSRIPGKNVQTDDSPNNHNPHQCNPSNRNPDDRNPDDHNPDDHNPRKHNPDDHDLAEHNPRHHSPRHHNPDQYNPDHNTPTDNNPGHHTPSYQNPDDHDPRHSDPNHHNPDDRFVVFNRVLVLLRRVAQERPLLCCVDDVHWLDRPSFDMLGFVARRLRRERIAMLITRCDESAPADPIPGVPARRLAPLEHRASLEILRDLALDPDATGLLASIAMGNPYALNDLAKSLTPEQLRGEAPLPQTLPADSALRKAYRAQLQRLPAEARRLVLLASADEELDVDTLVRAAAVAGLDIAALAPAESAGLLRVEGTAIRFTRPLVRAVAYHEATLAERRSVHTLLAATLDPETQPLRHYLHRAYACSGPDDLLAAQLERAAAVSPGRNAAASRALARSAELTHDRAAGAARLIAAARHAWRAGEPDRARLLLSDVRLMAAPARVHAESQVLQGEIELRVDLPSVARDRLLGAAETLAATDRYRAIDAFMRAGEAICQSGDYSHYPRVARQALALRRPNEPLAVEFVCELFATLSATFRGEHRQAADPLRRVLALAPVLDDAGSLSQASFAAILCGAEAEAYRLASRGTAVAQANRDVSAGPRALDLLALAEFAMGRYDNPATALRGLELARASGQENLVSFQLATLALLAAIVGDRSTCLLRVRAVKTLLAPHSTGRARAIVDWALALLDVSDGRYPEAAARLTAIMTSRGGGHLVVQLAATPQLVEAAVRCDAPGPARAALTVFDAWASHYANPRWLALSARCHALLAGRAGEADDYFHEALEQHRLSSAEFDRARTELLYGQRLRRQRRPAAAREQLCSALDTFERFEARPWIDQTTAELRAAGYPVRRRGVASTDVLTAQQAEIARLVAGGATNREIATRLLLSTRTIDHHMRNIFAKLGVRSRVELARLVA